MTIKVFTGALAAGLFSLAGPALAEGQCGVVQINRITAIKVSSATDSSLNTAVFDLMGAMAEAQAAANADLAEGIPASMGPKGQVLKAMLKSSAGLKVGAVASDGIPGLIESIAETRNDADDLYLSLSGERGDEAAFWPAPNETFSIQQEHSEDIIGQKSLVPEVMGVFNQTELAIKFYDWDGGSRDDYLGEAIIPLDQVGKGPQTTLAMTADHGGVIYGVQYQVLPVDCDGAAAGMYKTIRRANSGGGLEERERINMLWGPVALQLQIEWMTQGVEVKL